MSFVFFILFALSLVVMYVAIRRQLAPTTVTASAGVAVSIILMILYMLASPDVSVIQAIIMGILVGALFAGSTLAIAWYFQSNEIRHQQPRPVNTEQRSAPVEAGELEEYYE